MKPIRVLLLCTVLLMPSCASSPLERAAAEAFTVSVKDNPEAQAFDVSMKSNVSRKLCLTIEQWPRGGHVFIDGAASLETSGNIVPANVNSFGYCPGGCGLLEIEPNGQLSGQIAYSAFGDPQIIARAPHKNLRFTVEPFYCR